MGREVIFSDNQERMTAIKDKVLRKQPKQLDLYQMLINNTLFKQC